MTRIAPSIHSKIIQFKSWIKGQKLQIPIEVAKGVKLGDMPELIKHSADIFIAGSVIFMRKIRGMLSSR